MCGILGFSWEDGKKLKECAKNLNHRGPDEEGYFTEGVSLAHKRLSIIDLSTGQQPMLNEDGTVVIVFNGEIYNFQELKKTLQDKHEFRTKSDTEVIIHAYEEFGLNCLQKLDGVFAFAIYDKHRNKIFLARDRMGEKPLYYMLNEQGLSFSSELKALPFLSRTIDAFALEQYLTFYCVPAPRSIYQEGKKLLPGHYLLYDIATKELTIQKYWDLQFGAFTNLSFGELKQEIISQLKQSIKERLIADVPLGIFLSGGIDSSSIVALASQFTDNLKTFSICFEENPNYSERKYIDIVSKQFNTENTNYNFTFKDVIECFDKLVWVYDEPYGDSSMFPTYIVCKLARKDVKVVLSGDGGDELFGGYENYLNYRLLRKLKRIPLSRQFSKILMRFKSPKLYGLGRDMSARDVNEVFFYQSSKFVKTELEKLKPSLTNEDVYVKHRQYWNPNRPMESLMICDQRTNMHDDFLVKTDRASMLAGVEVRVPYLKHSFVEFANSIPAAMKLTDTTKYILKEALRGILPDQIIDRKKMGFMIPLKEWILNELKPLMEDLLLSDKFRQRGLFQENYILDLIKNHSKTRHTDRLWTLMCLEKWFRICHDPFT